MTLADLLATLSASGALPASRAKDIKTSLRYLAAALGTDGPEQCPVDAALAQEATWVTALETHFATLETKGRVISAGTRRNTRNNLRVVLRLAEGHGLLAAPLPIPLLTKPRRKVFERQYYATSPYHTTYHPQQGPRHYGLLQAQWPPDIQDGWQTYLAKCGLRLREETLQCYVKNLVTYLGYLTHVCARTPTWADVFDVAQLTAFVRWHAVRLQRPRSAHGRNVVITVAAMANVLEHPHAQALADLRKTLQPPDPLHNKETHHWVSLATLEAVAEACLHEGRAPLVDQRDARASGAYRATRFQIGLILKLLVRVPLRQRNVRELRLNEQLYKDPATGDWHLYLRGSALKIGTRQGRVNEYKLNLSQYAADFVPLLEEFLQVYRPRLRGATTSPFLFLTHRGHPYTRHSLRVELSYAVAMRTGQRFYPHLIRTVWATECIEKTQDYAAAAEMLGDTLAVVMQTYYHLDKKVQQAKAAKFLRDALRPRTAGAKR